MAARLGQAIYWIAVIVAVLFAVLGAYALFSKEPLLGALLFIPAVIAWGILVRTRGD
jgi:membrane associated rhomboid family serine protease